MSYQMKMFTIMLGMGGDSTIVAARKKGTPYVVVAVPWEMIEPHERQAHANHSQSLATLHSRGGLSACEALAVLENREWHRMAEGEANETLCRKVAEWVDAQVAAPRYPKVSDE